ncbi:tRNA-splicing endonuclease subunit Sen34 [Aedes aegypti]|uniref:tRNA-splicing endonuclease subunit Sen34 n=1 Tax=Aedes aegypti TaxID=7159 RepID=A0A1S4FJZ8_AEDAE|nr:tRNA-splicing endonuclease subunit Sen34 [Aedes aegypti]
MEGKIPVTFQHNRGFIYDVEDYMKLRFTHRIVGNLFGTPVSKPRSASSFGLPAVLTPLEVRLALEEGLIVLIDKNAQLTRSPSEEAKQQFARLSQQQIHEQKQPVIEKRLKEFEYHLPKILAGKRKKLLKSGVKEEDITINEEQLIKEEKHKLETMEIDKLVQIPQEYPLKTECTYVNYQLPKNELLKYKVFRDIWKTRPVFITGGDSFGCDFLLYPGDPLYYHASHVVHVLTDASQRLDAKYLIRCCRLSVVVNKVCIFAYEEPSGGVRYQTMEWEGNVAEDV